MPVIKRAIELTCDDLRIPVRDPMDTIKLSDPVISLMRYCSIKLDGNWTAVHVSPYGEVSVWTRKNINITAKVRHNMWYNCFELYVKGPQWIIGELWGQNVPCSSISSHLAERLPLEFIAFDVRGYEPLEVAKKYCNKRNIEFVPFFRNDVAHKELTFCELRCKDMYSRMQQRHTPADGLVFSDGCNLNCRKWKPSKTIDLVFVGINAGKKGGKHEHGVGTISLRTAEGHLIARASGMSNAERKYILNNTQLLKGQVVEIRYMGIGTQGKLRHPVFVRFRTDKTAEECSVYQDEELAAHFKKD